MRPANVQGKAQTHCAMTPEHQEESITYDCIVIVIVDASEAKVSAPSCSCLLPKCECSGWYATAEPEFLSLPQTGRQAQLSRCHKTKKSKKCDFIESGLGPFFPNVEKWGRARKAKRQEARSSGCSSKITLFGGVEMSRRCCSHSLGVWRRLTHSSIDSLRFEVELT